MSQNENEKSHSALGQEFNPNDQDSQDFLADGSPELAQYIATLISGARETNPRSICASCWCFLTWSQKQSHPTEHVEKYLQRPSKFSNSEEFKTLALNYGHIKEKNGIIWFQKIRDKPLTCIQSV